MHACSSRDSGCCTQGNRRVCNSFLEVFQSIDFMPWQSCAREDGNRQDSGLSDPCNRTARVVQLPPAISPTYICSYTFSDPGVGTANRKRGAHSSPRVGINKPPGYTMCGRRGEHKFRLEKNAWVEGRYSSCCESSSFLLMVVHPRLHRPLDD